MVGQVGRAQSTGWWVGGRGQGPRARCAEVGGLHYASQTIN